MRVSCAIVFAGMVAGWPAAILAQDLSPRAYLITPLHSNAVILTWSFSDGDLDVGNLIPATITGRYNIPILSYYHSLSILGRSANLTASVPYGVGNFVGSALGRQRSVYRSGLLDLGFRVSVNLKGGPALPG